MALLRWIEWFIRMVVLAGLDLRFAGVRRVLVPFLLLQILVLYMCADPLFELWAGVMAPLLGGVLGDYYLHYPQSYIGLPVTGSAARVVIELFVAPFVLGWCAWAIYYRLLQTRQPNAELRRQSTKTYPALFLFALIQIGVWLLAYGLPLSRLNESGLLSYRLHAGLTVLGGVIPVVLLAPFFYTVPHLIIEEKGLRAAMLGSLRRFRSQWFLPLFLSAIPWMVGIPFNQALQRSARLAGLLRPELILVVMALEALVSLLAAFIVLDAAMRLYRKPRTEGR